MDIWLRSDVHGMCSDPDIQLAMAPLAVLMVNPAESIIGPLRKQHPL